MNPTFTLAPATTADVLAVLEIINHAKAFLKAARLDPVAIRLPQRRHDHH
ncbi:MAG: hypothetical protein ACFWUH_01585 [Limosilactobacillus fermentum]|jgi:hypothetical protein